MYGVLVGRMAIPFASILDEIRRCAENKLKKREMAEREVFKTMTAYESCEWKKNASAMNGWVTQI